MPQAARKRAPDVVLGRYIAEGHGVVALAVTNPTGRFLTDVEVEVVFARGHSPGLRKRRRSWSYSQVPVPTGEDPGALLYGHVGIGGFSRGHI